MTASVSTRGMKGARFSDEEREQMYLKTILFYLENLPADQPIVFAENSGWDLSAFGKKVEKLAKDVEDGKNSTIRLFSPPSSRVEFISVDPSICNQSRGKGYNEVLLINDAIRRSVAIRESGAFMKVTGRYPVRNVGFFIDRAKAYYAKGGRYYGDMKDHKIYDFLFPGQTNRWNGHAAETAVFSSTVPFWNEVLAGCYAECNDYTDQWLEVVMYRRLVPFRGKKDSGVSLRYPVEPGFWDAQQGSYQRTKPIWSGRAWMGKLLRFVSNFVRKYVKWLWL